MIPLITTEPPERNYALDELVIDSALGICPLAVTSGLALLIGGIYYLLWPIGAFTPLAYFVMGACRGKGLGSPWLMALCFSGAVLLHLTDAMYEPSSRPFASHAAGTELVIEFIEQHWAPTVKSVQMLQALPDTAGKYPAKGH